MNAPKNAAANTTAGAARAAALLAAVVAAAPGLEPLRVPAALPDTTLPDAPAVGVAVAVGAPQSWVDANVWQLLEAGMDGVYGGVPTGPERGWNQVVVWPGAVV